mgnify:CR=1 FL=1
MDVLFEIKQNINRAETGTEQKQNKLTEAETEKKHKLRQKISVDSRRKLARMGQNLRQKKRKRNRNLCHIDSFILYTSH